MANEKIVEMIRRSVVEFNVWRMDHLEEVLDLRGADLSGLDLHEIELMGADLTGAILRKTQLWDANLIGTDFTNADLTDANLTDAFCTTADFDGAILENTNLHNVVGFDRPEPRREGIEFIG